MASTFGLSHEPLISSPLGTFPALSSIQSSGSSSVLVGSGSSDVERFAHRFLAKLLQNEQKFDRDSVPKAGYTGKEILEAMPSEVYSIIELYLMTSAQAWFMEIMPIELRSNPNVEVEILRLPPQVLDETAEGVAPQIMVETRERMTFYSSQFHIGLQADVWGVNWKQGLDAFLRKAFVIPDRVLQTFQKLALTAIVQQPPLQERYQRLQHRAPSTSVQEIMEMEIDTFLAGMARDGFPKLLKYLDDITATENARRFDVIVIQRGDHNYLAYHTKMTKYYETGPESQSLIKRGGDEYIAEYLPDRKIFIMDPISAINIEENIRMRSRRMFASFTIIDGTKNLHLVRSGEYNVANELSVEIRSAPRNGLVKIGIIDALRYSGRFNSETERLDTERVDGFIDKHADGWTRDRDWAPDWGVFSAYESPQNDADSSGSVGYFPVEFYGDVDPVHRPPIVDRTHAESAAARIKAYLARDDLEAFEAMLRLAKDMHERVPTPEQINNVILLFMQIGLGSGRQAMADAGAAGMNRPLVGVSTANAIKRVHDAYDMNPDSWTNDAEDKSWDMSHAKIFHDGWNAWMRICPKFLELYPDVVFDVSLFNSWLPQLSRPFKTDAANTLAGKAEMILQFFFFTPRGHVGYYDPGVSARDSNEPTRATILNAFSADETFNWDARTVLVMEEAGFFRGSRFPELIRSKYADARDSAIDALTASYAGLDVDIEIRLAKDGTFGWKNGVYSVSDPTTLVAANPELEKFLRNDAAKPSDALQGDLDASEQQIRKNLRVLMALFNAALKSKTDTKAGSKKKTFVVKDPGLIKFREDTTFEDDGSVHATIVEINGGVFRLILDPYGTGGESSIEARVKYFPISLQRVVFERIVAAAAAAAAAGGRPFRELALSTLTGDTTREQNPVDPAYGRAFSRTHRGAGGYDEDDWSRGSEPRREDYDLTSPGFYEARIRGSEEPTGLAESEVYPDMHRYFTSRETVRGRGFSGHMHRRLYAAKDFASDPFERACYLASQVSRPTIPKIRGFVERNIVPPDHLVFLLLRPAAKLATSGAIFAVGNGGVGRCWMVSNKHLAGTDPISYETKTHYAAWMGAGVFNKEAVLLKLDMFSKGYHSGYDERLFDKEPGEPCTVSDLLDNDYGSLMVAALGSAPSRDEFCAKYNPFPVGGRWSHRVVADVDGTGHANLEARRRWPGFYWLDAMYSISDLAATEPYDGSGGHGYYGPIAYVDWHVTWNVVTKSFDINHIGDGYTKYIRTHRIRDVFNGTFLRHNSDPNEM